MPATTMCLYGVSPHSSDDSFSVSTRGRNVTSQLRNLARLGSNNTKTLIFFVPRSSGVTWEACRGGLLSLQAFGYAGVFTGLLLHEYSTPWLAMIREDKRLMELPGLRRRPQRQAIRHGSSDVPEIRQLMCIM